MASLDYSRVWLVTGSSQGLGRSIVAHLLAHSQRVVATARNVNTLDGFKSKYSSDQLLILRLDVTEPEEIDEVFAKTEEHFHRLDIVINNAGYGVNGEIEGTPDHVARGELETPFWGPVNIMKQRVRDHRNVDEAIILQRQALTLTAAGGRVRPEYLNNVANTLICRFELSGDISDVDEAIVLQKQALALTPDDRTDKAVYLNNIGKSHICRLKHLREPRDAQEAIRHQAKAIALMPEGQADIPRFIENLAESFVYRSECLGNRPHGTETNGSSH